MKKQLLRLLKKFSVLSSSTAVLSANTTSGWIAYQAELDDEIKKLKRF